jgi:putative transposase
LTEITASAPGWISRNRRLWKDPEATLASAQAFLYAAAVMILVRRLGRAS